MLNIGRYAWKKNWYLCLSEVCYESFGLVVLSAEREIFILKKRERIKTNSVLFFLCKEMEAIVLWERGEFSRDANFHLKQSFYQVLLFPSLTSRATWYAWTLFKSVGLLWSPQMKYKLPNPEKALAWFQPPLDLFQNYNTADSPNGALMNFSQENCAVVT